MSKKNKVSDGDIAKVLLDDLDRFEHFTITYWKEIVIFCVAVVVFVAVFAITVNVRTSMKEKAFSVIAEAKTEEAINKVISEYPGNPAINSARLKLASIYMGDKKYDKALEQYQFIAGESDIPDEMRWRAKLNSFYILELMGKTEQAAAGFAEFGSNTLLPEAFRNEANYSAARLYCSLKNIDKAKASLKLASAAAPANIRGFQSFWATQSKLFLDKISGTSKTETKNN